MLSGSLAILDEEILVCRAMRFVLALLHKGIEGVATIHSSGEVVRDNKVYIITLIVSIQTLSNMRWLTPV